MTLWLGEMMMVVCGSENKIVGLVLANFRHRYETEKMKMSKRVWKKKQNKIPRAFSICKHTYHPCTAEQTNAHTGKHK